MNHIEDLVAAYRILAEHDVIDAYGHVSVRSPRDPNRYLLAGHRAPELVTEDDIIEYDLDSNPQDARGRESVRERFIHGEVYKARPEVTAVVLSLPTAGPMLLTALKSQDMYLAGSFLMFLAVMIVIGVLISDLALAALDPRIRLEGGVSR